VTLNLAHEIAHLREMLPLVRAQFGQTISPAGRRSSTRYHLDIPMASAPKPVGDDGQRRLSETKLLLSVTSHLTNFETLDVVLPALVEMTAEIIGQERSSFF